MGITKKVLGVYKRYGFRGFCTKLSEKINAPVRSYTKKVEEFLPTSEELLKQCQTNFTYQPYVSIVVPAYETKPEFLEELFLSIQNQTYQKIELCIADASKTNQVEIVVEKIKNQWKQSNPLLRLQYMRLEENRGISLNTNAGLKLVTGDYIGFMDHDDVLAKNALYEVVSVINQQKEAQLIYSDEDKVSYDLKKHTQPHFKPDFNLELIQDNNYICHFLVISKELLAKVKGFREEYDGSQDYDFVLRCIEETEQIRHIPKILYHWRMHSASTAGDSDSKTYTFDAGQKALQAHFLRQGIKAEVTKRIEVGCFYIKYQLPENFQKQDYFLSKSDNVIPVTKDWEKELHSYCAQENVGIVGTKLITGNHKIKQNGLLFLEDGTILESFKGLPKDYKGYVRRAVLAQDLNAVSLDFAMIKKEAYDKVGGIDETLPYPYRDLDFCLKLKKAGYRIVQNSFVEGLEQGEDKKLRNEDTKKSKQIVFEKHKDILEGKDGFYNPNFSHNMKTFSIE